LELRIPPHGLASLKIDNKGIKIYPDHVSFYFIEQMSVEQALRVYDAFRSWNGNIIIIGVRFKFRCPHNKERKCHTGIDCQRECSSASFWQAPIRGIRIDFKPVLAA